jgi:phage gpG-like protein
MDAPELKGYIDMMNSLAKVYTGLPNLAATEAVNFSKERFRDQNWDDGRLSIPWKKRKEKKRDKRRGRAILIDKAVLKRDVRKIYVGPDKAIIGTTRTTQGYAKAHNQGFKGTVTVKEHRRKKYKKVKEKYTTRDGTERSRTSKQIDSAAGDTIVKTHNRKMNLPKRQFLGQSPALDRRITRVITATFIRAIKK